MKGFKTKFESVVGATILPEQEIPEIVADIVIELKDINAKFYNVIQQFAPFGPQNLAPTFITKNVKDSGYARRIGRDESHLKLNIVEDEKYSYGAVGFGLGDKLHLVQNGQPFDIVYVLEENHWNGVTSLQLRIKDIQACDALTNNKIEQ